jgi:site-specific recombinase XerD
LGNLKTFFGDRKLENITVSHAEAYRDERRQRPAKNRFGQTVKGATVNRELECLKCTLDFAMKRKHIAENPAAEVKHSNETSREPDSEDAPTRRRKAHFGRSAGPSSCGDHSPFPNWRNNI